MHAECKAGNLCVRMCQFRQSENGLGLLWNISTSIISVTIISSRHPFYWLLLQRQGCRRSTFSWRCRDGCWPAASVASRRNWTCTTPDPRRIPQTRQPLLLAEHQSEGFYSGALKTFIEVRTHWKECQPTFTNRIQIIHNYDTYSYFYEDSRSAPTAVPRVVDSVLTTINKSGS